MSKLKLTKKIAGSRLVFSPTWITDGCWAIKRELVENGEHFNAFIAQIFLEAPGSQDMTDEQILKAIPGDPNLSDKYEISPIVLDNSYKMRVFFNGNNNYVFINEDYRILLGLSTVHPSRTMPNLFFNDEGNKAIMRLRTTAEDTHLELAIRALDSLRGAA